MFCRVRSILRAAKHRRAAPPSATRARKRTARRPSDGRKVHMSLRFLRKRVRFAQARLRMAGSRIGPSARRLRRL